jgi:hypothetical protein
VTLQDDVVIRKGSEEPGQYSFILGAAPGHRPERRSFEQHVLMEQFHGGRHILPAFGDSQLLRQREHPIAVHKNPPLPDGARELSAFQGPGCGWRTLHHSLCI